MHQTHQRAERPQNSRHDAVSGSISWKTENTDIGRTIEPMGGAAPILWRQNEGSHRSWRFT